MRRLSILLLLPALWALRLGGAARRHPPANRGQALVEYGLILLLVVLVCIAILTAMGGTLYNNWYLKLSTALP